MEKKISFVVAVSENGVIGDNNQLLWHLPNDLKHFKALTVNKPIIMGRKTFESIGRPLPNRQNIILTRDKNFQAPGCEVVHTVEEALMQAGEAPEVSIVGGGEIYRLFYPYASCLHLTIVHTQMEGQTTFQWNPLEWEEVSHERHSQDEKHRYDYSFITLERRGNYVVSK